MSSLLLPLFSSAWRISVFIFLRVIPTTLFKKILPPLWLLYLTTWYLTPPPIPEGPATTNGDSKNELDKKQQEQPTVPTSVLNKLDPLATIVFSLPSPIRALRTANLTINVLLLLAATELIFYPYFDHASDVVFTRLGAVHPDSAKITVRYPSTLHNATEHEVQITWRQATSSSEGEWQDGPILALAAERDWVQTVRLQGLWPSTTYEYRLKNATAVLPYPEHPIRFKTFPDPNLPTGSHFRFVVSSCVTPNFPYTPLHGRRIRGFDLLADYLWPADPSAKASTPTPIPIPEASSETLATTVESDTAASPSVLPVADAAVLELHPPVEFMLFLGDFIYADVPLYFGDDQNMYQQFYRRNYQSPSFRKIYERLPIFHTYDDHDIKNNYIGQGNDSKSPFANASNAYRLYNADANYDSMHNDSHYYDFRYGDVAFFVLDTRRYRTAPHENPSISTMLGEKQLSALYDWLGKVNGTTTFKFIVSSVPFTSLWQMDAQVDSWAAYAKEKAELLEVLHTVPNVMILSGDRHEFAVIEFSAAGTSHQFMEVSTSPMSMFWIPFVRTLKMRTDDMVLHSKVNTRGDQSVTTQEIPRENVVKYLAKGNYKFSALEVDTRDLNNPVINLETVIDGKVAFTLRIVGEPVQFQSSTALGTIVPQTFKGILDRLGLSPTKWF
ncbi:PhoD-like phosphatase-domain-containing protein [Cristinia sonorae]|uniref:PhoD-like phosphatase-domain-containing protein n=1 Tax=Cristinia sonorae TaxID=1940300 RepID=A0A8K0XVG3_9AGAR|nr:PhoD-like phosphatase-domain-containing protein [Cristinia sonorae]